MCDSRDCLCWSAMWESFRYHCLHCRTVNRKDSGMNHAFDCPYRDVQVDL